MKSIYFITPLLLCNLQCVTKQPLSSIVGHWQLTAIVASNGHTEKAPALTIFNFNPDSSYTLFYANAKKYTGIYSLQQVNKTLCTQYTINSNILYDTANIIQLTDTIMILKENRESGDTIKFRRV